MKPLRRTRCYATLTRAEQRVVASALESYALDAQDDRRHRAAGIAHRLSFVVAQLRLERRK
jgi:hypothetical protein